MLVRLGLMTLVLLMRIVMMIRILVRVILIQRRTVVHSVRITSSKQSSSQTSVRVTQQMGDEVTLIKQK